MEANLFTVKPRSYVGIREADEVLVEFKGIGSRRVCPTAAVRRVRCHFAIIVLKASTLFRKRTMRSLFPRTVFILRGETGALY